MTEFAAPSSATGVKWEDFKGALLVIEPHKLEEGVLTSLGAKDAVRADVHVLDGPNAGDTYADTLIFPRVLIGQTRASIGKKVLGRLGQGNAKPGQNAPWMLSEATPQDQAAAQAWLAQRSNSAFAQPQTTTSQPPF